MKIIQGTPEGMGSVMSEADINMFLEEKINLHLATVDENGEPNIQPIWFYYDKTHQKIYLSTSKSSKKIQNIRKKPGVYFSVDQDSFPYKCVKGKATATILEGAAKNVPIVERICLKYIGTLDDHYSKMLIDIAKNGGSVVLELTPRFYSTWDFSKTK